MASTSKSTQSRSNQQPTQQHFSLADFLAALESNGCKVQQANGGWKAQCPAHLDRTPSLSINEKGGKLLIHCHAGCSYEEILAALDSAPAAIKPNGSKAPVPLVRRRPAGGACALPTGPQITTYHYVGADGNPAFAVVRKDTSKGKTITQWTPSGEDGLWVPSGYKKGKRPLYRLPEVLESTGKKVVIVEGEKCVEAGKAAFPTNCFTTFSGGSGAWQRTDFTPLSGRKVSLLADACEDGRAAMLHLAAHLSELGAGPIKIALPEGEDGADIADWIDQRVAKQELKRHVRPWTPPEEAEALLQEANEEPAATFKRKDASALAGALAGLDGGIEVRYNTRSQMAEFKEKKGWEPFTDLDTAQLRDRIERQFKYHSERGDRPLAYSEARWVHCLNVQLWKRRVDPFLIWLESLEPWDGTERLQHVLTLMLGAEGELAQWASRFLFVGPIQRAYEPGSKLDEIPVLIGGQGIGKSALIRECLPAEYQNEGFSDGLNLAARPQERAEALQGKVFVEASEMAGASRAELESLKAFVSRQNDGSVRLAYRRNPESTPRRCVIVGTSNNLNCLPNDPTGNRRFVPIICSQGNNVEKMMAPIRDQLWAEALQMHKDGERANLPRTLHTEAKSQADGSRRRDEILEDKIEKLALETNGPLALGEIATKLHLGDVDMRVQQRLAGALVALGWEKRRELKDGKRLSNWYPPDLQAPS